jgi:hypothetical protein
MNDTPENIKKLQLKIWLSKSPMERLRQMMENNASLFQFWANARRGRNEQEKKPNVQANNSRN